MNNLGEGPISGNVTIRSAEDRPARQVLNVRCVAYNSTGMTVTWDMIDENDYAVLRGRLLGMRNPSIDFHYNENRFHLGYTVRYWVKARDELQNYWERRFPRSTFTCNYHWSRNRISNTLFEFSFIHNSVIVQKVVTSLIEHFVYLHKFLHNMFPFDNQDEKKINV